MLLPHITVFFLVVGTSRSSDTIAVHQNISDGQTIVSANAKFELGFFSPGSSKNRYLGIWYKNTSPQTTIAWVANRETPLIDTSGVIKLDNQGNLTLVNGSGKVIWSSNSSATGTNMNLVAQLLDTGNLVIKNGNETNNEIVIWQSFDYPGDTCLPGMKLGKNFITGRETYQTSWRSTDDPSPGERGTALDCGPGEGFQKFSSMKLPDTKNAVYSSNMSLSDCAVACKNNCACTAYANPNITPGGVGCLLWFGDLIDVRVFPQNGQDLYVRLAASELSDLHASFHRKKRVVMVVTLSIAAVLTLLGLILAFYIRRRWKKKSYVEREGRPKNTLNKGDSSQIGSAEVPLFSLAKISRATNDFSVDNKLGEGGFGPVYKGVLEEGQEIAVKRLSRSSGQGLVEFENEVICIAKLQHRNLVKLLGYCIQGDDRMLIYEYLPNKSLDNFLFDESRKSLLDWPQRFQIIHGIARGLLYLHQDSRLKVVHRDLKAGNILLDYQMRPKISDFGLARMFEEGESEADTKRVVGTLGYISPEYAMKGHFSVKSDIFSFGVLVLEIVSGKKNKDFVHEDHDDNLLGHAWRLYREGKPLDLIDECFGTSYSAYEVLRSVHVGLLCVQHRVEDRPDTQTVVAMLGGEGSLPSPNKPAFYIQEGEINSPSILPLLSSSVNGVTFSQVDGR
ncbi:putative protein kinase RLK-Pelle-DLSV family [Helianthus annuus]|nr:putative protein kinase RLK-Pelle-DLSV family [Helianthus annuus]